MRKQIAATNFGAEDILVLTPSGLMSFLTQVEELNGLELDLSETDSGLIISIGNSSYTLQCATELDVEDEVVDEIDNINEEGYDELKEELGETFEDPEAVEGGIIKELAKTLLVGGLVRLTKDAILKS